jgi:hypothetical protein
MSELSEEQLLFARRWHRMARRQVPKAKTYLHIAVQALTLFFDMHVNRACCARTCHHRMPTNRVPLSRPWLKKNKNNRAPTSHSVIETPHQTHLQQHPLNQSIDRFLSPQLSSKARVHNPGTCLPARMGPTSLPRYQPTPDI